MSHVKHFGTIAPSRYNAQYETFPVSGGREIDDGAFGSEIVLGCLAQNFGECPAKAWPSRRFFDR
ncbi:MAG: hypothetical protein ACREC0_03830 [Methylocella sp.]